MGVDKYCEECDLFDNIFFSHCNDCLTEVNKAFNDNRCGATLVSYVIAMRDSRPRLLTPTPHTVIPTPVIEEEKITYHPSEVTPPEKNMLSKGYASLI